MKVGLFLTINQINLQDFRTFQQLQINQITKQSRSSWQKLSVAPCLCMWAMLRRPPGWRWVRVGCDGGCDGGFDDGCSYGCDVW